MTLKKAQLKKLKRISYGIGSFTICFGLDSYFGRGLDVSLGLGLGLGVSFEGEG